MALPPILKDNLRLPVVAAPMFIISTPALVIAQCKAGVVGSFPALNARPAEQLEVWLRRINEELDRIRTGPPHPSRSTRSSISPTSGSSTISACASNTRYRS